LIEKDAAISAKVLQVVNSAFFGVPRRVSYVRDAMSYLGTNMVRNLVLSVETFRAFEPSSSTGVDPDAMQKHAVLVGQAASRYLDDKRQKEDAFTAGVLHDVGNLVLATQFQDELRAINQRVKTGGERTEAEREIVGATHAEIGAFLLGIWALPYSIVEAVAHHHLPDAVAHTEFDVLCAVHVADALTSEGASAPNPLQASLIEQLGKGTKLAEWQAASLEAAKDARA
jgi:HD-like signal output (HDOD) protein